ncbi:MAG: hypothetical protein IPF47_14815 [Gemmatimonadetes bacterium]|nr:hypothetical protein [Gemmatimonadota bacterium]
MSEGLSGGGSTKDLETIFQLAYLRFTAPRRDSSAFLAFKAQVAPFFANRANSPDAVFSDTVMLTLAQHHPRAQPVSQALFDRVSFGKAFDIYRDRFADASDFTFVFVGSFTLDRMRPLVEQWLASLPATGRREAGRDIGIRAPGRGGRAHRSQGSRAQGVDAGAVPRRRPSPRRRASLARAERVSEMRLLENLREALGGTYSVSVGGQASKLPAPSIPSRSSLGRRPRAPTRSFARSWR